jgi:hypothetical protein
MVNRKLDLRSKIKESEIKSKTGNKDQEQKQFKNNRISNLMSKIRITFLTS